MFLRPITAVVEFSGYTFPLKVPKPSLHPLYHRVHAMLASGKYGTYDVIVMMEFAQVGLLLLDELTTPLPPRDATYQISDVAILEYGLSVYEEFTRKYPDLRNTDMDSIWREGWQVFIQACGVELPEKSE